LTPTVVSIVFFSGPKAFQPYDAISTFAVPPLNSFDQCACKCFTVFICLATPICHHGANRCASLLPQPFFRPFRLKKRPFAAVVFFPEFLCVCNARPDRFSPPPTPLHRNHCRRNGAPLPPDALQPPNLFSLPFYTAVALAPPRHVPGSPPKREMVQVWPPMALVRPPMRLKPQRSWGVTFPEPAAARPRRFPPQHQDDLDDPGRTLEPPLRPRPPVQNAAGRERPPRSGRLELLRISAVSNIYLVFFTFAIGGPFVTPFWLGRGGISAVPKRLFST